MDNADMSNAALRVDTYPYQFQRSVEQGCYEVYFGGLHLGQFDASGNWRPSRIDHSTNQE